MMKESIRRKERNEHNYVVPAKVAISNDERRN
jgi:hypothetical protein